MSKSKLVKTTFQSGPDDGLLAVDVYESSSGGVVNSYDKTESEALDILDTLNGKASSGSSNSLVSSLAEALGGNLFSAATNAALDSSNPFTSLNPSSLTRVLDSNETISRLGGQSDTVASCLRDFSDPVRNNFTIPKNDTNSIFGTFKDTTKKISSVFPYSDTKSLGRLVNDLSKGNYPTSFVDKGALSNLIGNTINIASITKLPKAFSTIAEYSGIDQKTLTKAAVLGINASLQRGDIEVFKDVARTSVANDLRYVMPNVVNKVISSMDRPKEVTYGNTGKYYQEARDSFTAVDPNWNKTKRSGTSVINASVIGNNPFAMQCVRSSVTSTPLVIKPSPNGNLGNYVDPDYADITDPTVFTSIYGNDKTTEAKEQIINNWKNDTGRIKSTNEKKDDSYLMLMENSQNKSVIDSLQSDFPLLQLSTNSTIDKSMTFDSSNSFFS